MTKNLVPGARREFRELEKLGSHKNLVPGSCGLDSEGIKFDSEGIYYLTEGGERGVIDENEAPCEGSGFTAVRHPSNNLNKGDADA